ncbi:hypothetical protein VNO77_23138 [Canavalia gladiata]|uniref:Uncharacterized protein n=1 Tax=Canavalia gladiata TaxID=3824 RepID=A0AAN9L4F6_CANGL
MEETMNREWINEGSKLFSLRLRSENGDATETQERNRAKTKSKQHITTSEFCNVSISVKSPPSDGLSHTLQT